MLEFHWRRAELARAPSAVGGDELTGRRRGAHGDRGRARRFVAHGAREPPRFRPLLPLPLPRAHHLLALRTRIRATPQQPPPRTTHAHQGELSLPSRIRLPRRRSEETPRAPSSLGPTGSRSTEPRAASTARVLRRMSPRRRHRFSRSRALAEASSARAALGSRPPSRESRKRKEKIA
jgi:hypothetical protein